jgi:phosphomannomutase
MPARGSATGSIARSGLRVVNTIDGVRVKVGDGWWLVRASNTEAALVARAEAGDAATLERLVSEIQTSLALAGLDCSFD